MLKLRALGINFHPESPAMTQIKKYQKKVLYDKNRQKSLKFQNRRSQAAQKKYRMYDEKADPGPTYEKGMFDPGKPTTSQTTSDHNNCERTIKIILSDHNYVKLD